jgi:hypothetical protein
MIIAGIATACGRDVALRQLLGISKVPLSSETNLAGAEEGVALGGIL